MKQKILSSLLSLVWIVTLGIDHVNAQTIPSGCEDPSNLSTCTLDVQFNSLSVGTTTTDGDLKIDVGGKIGATHYCDESGDNCFEPTDVNESEIAVPLWRANDQGGTYTINDIINYNGNLYKNLTGTNTNNTPDVDTTNWESKEFKPDYFFSNSTSSWDSSNIVTWTGISRRGMTGSKEITVNKKGIYHIIFTAREGTASGYPTIQIRINNTVKANDDGRSTDNNTGYDSMTTSYVGLLNVGDKISLSGNNLHETSASYSGSVSIVQISNE